MTIATEEDIPAILALANWAAVNTAANFATEPEPESQWIETFRATRSTHPWVVKKDGDRVVGFAKGSVHRTRGAYKWSAEVSVYVDPTAHGRGIGRDLYDVLLATMRAQGYVTLIAGITPPNPASERLHKAVGFARCGTYHRVGWKFERWHDVGYWDFARCSRTTCRRRRSARWRTCTRRSAPAARRARDGARVPRHAGRDGFDPRAERGARGDVPGARRGIISRLMKTR